MNTKSTYLVSILIISCYLEYLKLVGSVEMFEFESSGNLERLHGRREIEKIL